MERKLLFDEVVETYAAVRPGYPEALLDDIYRICGLQAGASVLEIGCGTGQASSLLLQAGFRVTAIEIGARMCAYARQRFSANPAFQVLNLPFEEYAASERYDLVFSASAFHWIDPAIGYAKAHQLLKEDGFLLLVWNSMAESWKDSPVGKEIAEVYAELLPEKENDLHKQETRIKMIRESGYFSAPELLTYPYGYPLTAETYTQLLSTYSDHIALENSLREELFTRVKAIIARHGDRVIVPFATQAFFARHIASNDPLSSKLTGNRSCIS